MHAGGVQPEKESSHKSHFYITDNSLWLRSGILSDPSPCFMKITAVLYTAKHCSHWLMKDTGWCLEFDLGSLPM